MGEVEKFVQKHEKEKHATTEEFIETLKWYIKETNKLDAECSRAKRDIAEAFNSKIAELKKQQEENK